MSWIKKAIEFGNIPEGEGYDYPQESYADKAEKEIGRDVSMLSEGAQISGLTPLEAVLGLYIGKGIIQKMPDLQQLMGELEKQHIDMLQAANWHWNKFEDEAMNAIFEASVDADERANIFTELEDGIRYVAELKNQ